MAESPAHKLGQIIGDEIEAAIRQPLQEIADEYNLYLDYKHARPAREGRKKVSWKDSRGNAHDLDYVIEEGGCETRFGRPRAFIETAWRRYTKHSRNKAQEIQGAILPLVETYRECSPFMGAVLAGDFTDGALTQLRSHGFNLAYSPYETIIRAFGKAGADVSSDEKTTEDELWRKVHNFNGLKVARRRRIREEIRTLCADQLDPFFSALRRCLDRRVRSVFVQTLSGASRAFDSIEETPPLPDPLPSPVRFEVRDEAVHKAPHPAPAPPDERRAGAESAWTALKQLLDDLAESSAGQNHPRIGRVLDRCRSALGDEFQQMDVVMLGVHASRVDQIARRADDILMEEDAANLVAFNAQLGLFLGQFPEWSEYARGIADRFGSDEAEQQAVSGASDAVQAMRNEAPGLLAPDAVDALTELKEEATPEPDTDDPGAPAPPANRRSLLRACRDLFVKLIAPALRGVKRGIERFFEASTAGALSAASTWLLALAAGLPAEFGWLSGIVTYLARIREASSNGRPKNGNPPSD